MTRTVRLLAIVAAFFAGMLVWLRAADSRGEEGPETPQPGAVAATTTDAATQVPVSEAAARATWSERDWSIFESKVRWADAEELASLDPGAAIGRLSESFVGTPYTPGTLEAPGPEGLVINFREFDCVTFVENMLAMTRFIRAGGADLLDDPASAQSAYAEYLKALRYRGGALDGYTSRLHYFSEWLTDNDTRGLVTIVTGDLEPATDDEPIDFMSTHPDAYRQLADANVLGEISAMETRLNATGPRTFVPQGRIADVADHIETGDVIAATSTVEGLDIAHTGLALWVDGQLHMIHAPLVGSSVEISEVPLAERIQTISGQDGIMVARWRER